MMRIIKWFGVLFLVLVPCAVTAGGVMLRQDVTLDHPIIRLSDLFEGIKANDDAELAVAPAPGQSVTYDANVLAPLANKYGLEWQPSGYADKITLHRSAVYITTDMVRDLVLKKLNLAQNNDRKVSIKFDGHSPSLVLPAGEALDYDIHSLEYDRVAHRFRGKLVAQSGEGTKSQFIYGHVVVMVQVPVLSRSMKSGDVITDSDIRFEELEEVKLQGDVLLDETQILGQEIRRSQTEGSYFLARDIVTPRMVKRGDIVTLKLETPFMQITTKGRALQDGAEGALVRVTNINSKKVVEGTVMQEGVVQVNIAQQIASVN